MWEQVAVSRPGVKDRKRNRNREWKWEEIEIMEKGKKRKSNVKRVLRIHRDRYRGKKLHRNRD